MLIAPRNRSLLPLALGFLLLLLSAALSIGLSLRQEAATVWVRHTLEVKTRINLIRNLVTEAESGQRGYLITGRGEYLGPYETAVARLPSQIGGLDRSIQDNPVQRKNVAQLRPLIEAKLTELGASVSLARLGHRVRRQNIWRSSRLGLAECGPRLGLDVRRRACGAASADARWSAA